MGSGMRAQRAGFSLVELVVVVVILGILAAIAAPRVSRGSEDAQRNAIKSTLQIVRAAMDHYYVEHGVYPGKNPVDSSLNGTVFLEQLTKYTDLKGYRSGKLVAPYVYGPYLREPFPTNPFNEMNNVAVLKLRTDPPPGPNDAGWIAIYSIGGFKMNATAADLNGAGIDKPDDQGDMLLDP